MNDEKKNLQDEIGSLIKKEIPSISEHPLHMLDNQADSSTKPKSVIQKPIRTYESDLAEVFLKKDTSVMKMAIAENKKEDETESEIITNKPNNSSNSKKYYLLLISLILIIVGMGGGYYLYLQSPLAIKTIIKDNSKYISIINSDSTKMFPIGNTKGNNLAENVKNELMNISGDQYKINELIITENISSTTKKVSISKFIELVSIDMPDILNRSLKNNWMIGSLIANSEKSPFIILKSDFFQNSYAGMLKWEITMVDDLAILFNYKDRARPQNITSTSTLISYFTIKGKFEDKIILNRDVREFINEAGELLILYSFVDKDTLIITTSEDVLKEIINRIEKQIYLR